MRRNLLTSVLAILLPLAGCGLPGPALAPSLDLPRTVTDLSVDRVGDVAHLHWTNPTENTDRTPVRGIITVAICRADSDGVKTCRQVGTAPATAGAEQSYDDALPSSLTAPPARILYYSVRVLNHHGASAEASEPVRAASGPAPLPVSELSASAMPEGVALHWRTAGASGQQVEYRITRGDSASPTPRTFAVTLPESGTGGAQDTTAARNAVYDYRVQPVLHVRLEDASGAHYLEVAAGTSAAARIATNVKFPPPAPTGLVAIGTQTANGPAIDLAWDVTSNPHVAGYIVYRFGAEGAQDATVVSGATPLTGTSFRDTGVAAGLSYRYTIVATGDDGTRSAPSAAVTESAPQP